MPSRRTRRNGRQLLRRDGRHDVGGRLVLRCGTRPRPAGRPLGRGSRRRCLSRSCTASRMWRMIRPRGLGRLCRCLFRPCTTGRRSRWREAGGSWSGRRGGRDEGGGLHGACGGFVTRVMGCIRGDRSSPRKRESRVCFSAK